MLLLGSLVFLTPLAFYFQLDGRLTTVPVSTRPVTSSFVSHQARFILILLVGSFDVICAIVLIQSQSMMAFRVGGALESLQSQYFMVNLCFSMLTFDLQAQVQNSIPPRKRSEPKLCFKKAAVLRAALYRCISSCLMWNASYCLPCSPLLLISHTGKYVCPCVLFHTVCHFWGKIIAFKPVPNLLLLGVHIFWWAVWSQTTNFTQSLPVSALPVRSADQPARDHPSP